MVQTQAAECANVQVTKYNIIQVKIITLNQRDTIADSIYIYVINIINRVCRINRVNRANAIQEN